MNPLTLAEGTLLTSTMKAGDRPSLEALPTPAWPKRFTKRRVLLVFPPATLYNKDLPRCTYPLGVGYIAAVLEQHGYEVGILDAFAEGYANACALEDDPTFITYGLSDHDVATAITHFRPDIVGVSSIFSNQADNAHRMLAIAKAVQPGVVTVVGGAHARYCPEGALRDANLNAVILGEGELSFLRYAQYLNGALEDQDLRGVAFRQAGQVHITPAAPLIGARERAADGSWAELDSLPFPAWHLYNMERYFDIRAYQSPYTKGARVGQIYTSRGCSAKCTFCTTTNFWSNRLRRRSPDNVLEELRALIDCYAIDEFHVQDDNITNDMEQARRMFRGFAKIGLPWATPQGTALWRMDEELIDLMVDSGAYQITFAIESGVQRVLEQLIRKPLELEKTQQLITYAKKKGLHVHGFFIIGMPPMYGFAGESLEEMHATYAYAVDSGFDSASFFAATPIVGSSLLEECLRQGFIDPQLKLYTMSYKQGLISVPGLWDGEEIALLAGLFNTRFNGDDRRANTIRVWNASQY